MLAHVALLTENDRERDRAFRAVHGDLTTLRSDNNALERERVAFDELEHAVYGGADVGRDAIGRRVPESTFANVYHAMR